jgi:transcriptional regulator with XRE-family HTH domain
MPENRLNKRKLTPLQKRRKIALVEADLTASDVARKVGVSRQMVTMLLADKTRSDRLEMEIAKLLRVPRNELFPNVA